MRVGLDATPLLGRPTGVGRYVAGLVAGLLEVAGGGAGAGGAGVEPVLTAFTWRGAHDVPPLAPRVGRRVPARALQAAWMRADLPRLEWLGVRCDVFHATNYVLPPSRRAAGVLSVHDLSFVQHADTVSAATLRYRTLVPRGLARNPVVLTLTESLGDEVAAHYRLDRGRVRAARPGVDAPWFTEPVPDADARRRLGLPERYVIFVGTVEPRKNLPVLLEALRRLGPAAPPLLLAGPSGWGAPLDRDLVGSLAVQRLGWVDDAVLRSAVAGAEALVLPSRHEGFGLTPLEALACGTPVVTSDLPALREVTAEWARYTPVGDPDALAAAVLAELDSGSAAQPGARQSRRDHASAFTWRRCAEEALVAYRQALAG